MRAKVIIQNLGMEDCVKTITSRLADISGLKDVKFNKEEPSISFNYQTDEAALLVLERLNKII